MFTFRSVFVYYKSITIVLSVNFLYPTSTSCQTGFNPIIRNGGNQMDVTTDIWV